MSRCHKRSYFSRRWFAPRRYSSARAEAGILQCKCRLRFTPIFDADATCDLFLRAIKLAGRTNRTVCAAIGCDTAVAVVSLAVGFFGAIASNPSRRRIGRLSNPPRRFRQTVCREGGESNEQRSTGEQIRENGAVLLGTRIANDSSSLIHCLFSLCSSLSPLPSLNPAYPNTGPVPFPSASSSAPP